MPEQPEKTKIAEVDREDKPGTPRPAWSNDQENRSYYYDDAHGYEVFVPEDETDTGTVVLRNDPA